MKIAVFFLLFVCAVAAQANRTVWDGVYTVPQAERGKFDYMESCAQCHGEDLSGGGDAVMDPPPPLKVENFGVGRRDLGNLYDFMRAQMPGNAPGSLPRAVYADILAYLLRENSYPPGSVELPDDSDALSRIQVVKKP
jgi:mono/diheme cytochrome c family protein